MNEFTSCPLSHGAAVPLGSQLVGRGILFDSPHGACTGVLMSESKPNVAEIGKGPQGNNTESLGSHFPPRPNNP